MVFNEQILPSQLNVNKLLSFTDSVIVLPIAILLIIVIVCGRLSGIESVHVYYFLLINKKMKRK